MIVFCCGMSRSGGTVQYQIVKGLVEKAGKGAGLGFAIGLPTWADQYQADNWAVVKKEPSAPWALRIARNKARGRAIGIHRDPRAVAASLLAWRRQQGRFESFEQVWPEVVKAMDWYSHWEEVVDYDLAYRDAVGDWGAMALAVAQTLGLGLGAAECREVAEEWTVERNRERIAAMEKWMDTDTMLTQAHITGAGDKWLNFLTVGQVACVEAHFGEWMDGHGYRRLLGGASASLCHRSAAIGG